MMYCVLRTVQHAICNMQYDILKSLLLIKLKMLIDDSADV